MGSVNAGYYLYTWVMYIINILYLSFKYLIFVYHSNATTVTTIIAGITSDVLVVLSLFEKKTILIVVRDVCPSLRLSVCLSVVRGNMRNIWLDVWKKNTLVTTLHMWIHLQEK